MAGGAGISVAETGLRVAEQKAPVTGTLEAEFFKSANESISEGNAQEAAQKLKSPGNMLSEQQAAKKIDLVIKEDNRDAAGNPIRTAEQTIRQTEMKNLSNAIIHLREKGLNKISHTERQLLRNSLYEALYNHPTIRAIAQNKGIDVTTAAFKKMCLDNTTNILNNKQTPEMLANGLADILINAHVDYKTLYDDLDAKKDLDGVVTDLNDEIGLEAIAGGTPATGLYAEVDKQQQIVDSYKTKIITDPLTGLPKVVAINTAPDSKGQIKITAEIRLQQQNDSIDLIRNTLTDVEDYFSSNPKAKIYKNVKNPLNPAGPVINMNRGSWAAYKTSWAAEVKKVEAQNTRDQQVIEKIKTEETEDTTKLTQKQAELKTKLAELDKQTKSQLALDKKIKKTHDVNEDGSLANQEQEITESIKRLIVDSGLDLWEKGSAAVEASKPEVLKTLEQTVKDKVKEAMREVIYDENKKQIKKDRLNSELNDLLKNGVDKYGMDRLQILWNQCNGIGGFPAVVPPELQKLIPAISEIVDFSGVPPVIKNQEKLRSLSSETATEMLKVVAFKNPRWLEKKFTQDEQAMAKLKGDVLPDLIMQAHKDKSLQGEIEKGFGENLTKGKLIEKMARWDWSKLLWLLAILAGLGIVIGGVSLAK